MRSVYRAGDRCYERVHTSVNPVPSVSAKAVVTFVQRCDPLLPEDDAGVEVIVADLPSGRTADDVELRAVLRSTRGLTCEEGEERPIKYQTNPMSAPMFVTMACLCAFQKVGASTVRAAMEKEGDDEKGTWISLVVVLDDWGARYLRRRGEELGMDSEAVLGKVAELTVRGIPGVGTGAWARKRFPEEVVGAYPKGYDWRRMGTFVDFLNEWRAAAERLWEAWGGRMGKSGGRIEMGMRCIRERSDERLRKGGEVAREQGMSEGHAEGRFHSLQGDVPKGFAPCFVLFGYGLCQRRRQTRGTCGKCRFCCAEPAIGNTKVSEYMLRLEGIDETDVNWEAMRCVYMKSLMHLWYGMPVSLSRGDKKTPCGFVQGMHPAQYKLVWLLRWQIDWTVVLACASDGELRIAMLLCPEGSQMAAQMGWPGLYFACIDCDVDKKDPRDGVVGCDSFRRLTETVKVHDPVDADGLARARVLSAIAQVEDHAYGTRGKGVHIMTLFCKQGKCGNALEFPASGGPHLCLGERGEAASAPKRQVGYQGHLDFLPAGIVRVHAGGKGDSSGVTDAKGNVLSVLTPEGADLVGRMLLAATFYACRKEGASSSMTDPVAIDFFAGSDLRRRFMGGDVRTMTLQVPCSILRAERAADVAAMSEKEIMKQQKANLSHFRLCDVPVACVQDLFVMLLCWEEFTRATAETEPCHDDDPELVAELFDVVQRGQRAVGVVYGQAKLRECIDLEATPGMRHRVWSPLGAFSFGKEAMEACPGGYGLYTGVLHCDMDVAEKSNPNGGKRVPLTKDEVAALTRYTMWWGAVDVVTELLATGAECSAFDVATGEAWSTPAEVEAKVHVRLRGTRGNVYRGGVWVDIELFVGSRKLWVCNSLVDKLKVAIAHRAKRVGCIKVKEAILKQYGGSDGKGDKYCEDRWTKKLEAYEAAYPDIDRAAKNPMNVEIAHPFRYALREKVPFLETVGPATDESVVDKAKAYARAMIEGRDAALFADGEDPRRHGIALCPSSGARRPWNPAECTGVGSELHDLLTRVNDGRADLCELHVFLEGMCHQNGSPEARALFDKGKAPRDKKETSTLTELLLRAGAERWARLERGPYHVRVERASFAGGLTGRTAVAELKFAVQRGLPCSINGKHHGTDSRTKTYVMANVVLELSADGRVSDVISGCFRYLCSAAKCKDKYSANRDRYKLAIPQRIARVPSAVSMTSSDTLPPTPRAAVKSDKRKTESGGARDATKKRRKKQASGRETR